MSELHDPAGNTPQGAPPGRSATHIALRTAFILLAFTLAFTALMASVHYLTAPRVAASAQTEKLRLIAVVLAPTIYNNHLLNDAITLPPTGALGTTENTLLYRARKNNQPAALVFEAVAPDGYAGKINLLLAVAHTGELLALRVTQHKETPGLGDYIDPKKDRNKTRPWINQFDHLGFDRVPVEKWRVKKDGGHFDQMAGATISARAVANASGRALAWANQHREALFALPPKAQYPNTEALTEVPPEKPGVIHE
ncbi:MAG: electron transport complex subunit RsxG [Rugosibacter sp.]|jgi:electron transport complex protein RnfG|nr:Na+-translocating ferredoxin:NAD+ oxidoreductase subunit G [Rugosibacter sp.]